MNKITINTVGQLLDNVETEEKATKLVFYFKELQQENKQLKEDYNTLVSDNCYVLKLERKIDKVLKHTHEILGFLENCVGGNETDIQRCIKIFNEYLQILEGGNNE